MHSNDQTLAIARKFKANIFMHENIGYADPARAFGLSKCSFNWVLAIDSDEIVPHQLRQELVKIAQSDIYDIAKISFRNFFFGREIKGSGWGYKDQVIERFFKKGYLTYGTEVHNFVQINNKARIGSIIGRDVSIIHYNYDSVRHFIQKLNNYTDQEVHSTRFHYKGYPTFKILYHCLREIVGRFIIKKGYKDGWVGFYLAMAMAFYRASAIAKSNLPDEKDVIDHYHNQKMD